jgi:hypothetical protein
MRLKQSIKPTKKNLLNLKVTDLELKLIRQKAEKYTGGNISEWIRYAAIQLDPKLTDLVGAKPNAES